MNTGLEHKAVFVSGSSRGIGRAIAESFLREGARVFVTGRAEKDIDGFIRDNRVHAERIRAWCGDLTEETSVQKAVALHLKEFGRLDCLVPCIGKGAVRFGHELSSADWKNAFDINLWSAVALVNAALSDMKKHGGSITFIAALAGVEAVDAPLSYSTAKAALVAYAKHLSRELVGYHIRANAVAPGNVLFPGGRWEEKLKENREKFTRYIEESVPMKRFGKPEEVADVVVFLASERASFITGECVLVDGGQRRGF